MRAFATDPWASATLSFYAATVDTLEWARLDNVSLRKTPSAEIPGTQCLEIDDLGSNANPGNGQMLETSPTRLAQQSVGQANRRPPQSLFESDWIDLTGATQARLVFESWILGPGRYGEIQLRTIDGNWTPLLLLGSGDDWTSIEIELDAWLGQQIAVRFVRRDDNPGDAGIWRIRGWRVDVSR
jgi:hypothetical protein